MFWLGQAAGDAATANLKDIVLDNSVDREVRESAVFALSQRPREEGVSGAHLCRADQQGSGDAEESAVLAGTVA